MIVADTNLIAYLFLPTAHTTHAEAWLQGDPQWVAPLLWRSEFCNILATAMRTGKLSLAEAATAYQNAQALMLGGEHESQAMAALRLAERSGCTAYGCEFIALAQYLGIRLVTADAKLRKAFPDCTASLTSN